MTRRFGGARTCSATECARRVGTCRQICKAQPTYVAHMSPAISLQAIPETPPPSLPHPQPHMESNVPIFGHLEWSYRVQWPTHAGNFVSKSQQPPPEAVPPPGFPGKLPVPAWPDVLEDATTPFPSSDPDEGPTRIAREAAPPAPPGAAEEVPFAWPAVPKEVAPPKVAPPVAPDAPEPVPPSWPAVPNEVAPPLLLPVWEEVAPDAAPPPAWLGMLGGVSKPITPGGFGAVIEAEGPCTASASAPAPDSSAGAVLTCTRQAQESSMQQ